MTVCFFKRSRHKKRGRQASHVPIFSHQRSSCAVQFFDQTGFFATCEVALGPMCPVFEDEGLSARREVSDHEAAEPNVLAYGSGGVSQPGWNKSKYLEVF